MCLKTLCLSFIVITWSSTAAGAQQQDVLLVKDSKDLNNVTNIVSHLNGVFKSLNLSDIKVNIILNQINSQDFDNKIDDIDSLEFEKSLTYLFKTAIASNWYIKENLQDIAFASANITVHEILYELLWQDLKENHNKLNPLLYIELYKDIQSILIDYTSNKLTSLQNKIQSDIVQVSAQVLQSYFIHNSTVRTLLDELKNLNNNVYQTTIPQIFANLYGIEHQAKVSKDLLNFDARSQEAVHNHITYIKYLKSINELVPFTLYENLELLIARPDFVKIPAEDRQTLSKVLPFSMATLFSAQKVCLRNTTTNFYLYECPQTYLMCTNFIANNEKAINRKKAAFQIDRVGNQQYTLKSPYWSRYIRLQSNNNSKTTTITNNTTSSNITKNLYSDREASSWLIRFQGNYTTIQDPTQKFYVCGGDPLYWSKAENYAYTRKSNDFYNKQNQCLWLLEDCSDVN